MTINHPDWRNEDWDFEPSDQFLQGQPTDQVEYIYDEGGLEQDEPTAEFEAEDDSMFGKLRSQIVEGIAGALERRPSSPLFKKVEDAWVDGQRAMVDLVNRLSPLEEYASAYMDDGEGLWQGGKLDFPNLIVGSSGVTLVDGGMRLDDHGMWRIDTQIWADYWVQTTTGIPDSLARMEWEIRVLRPDRSLYHRKRGRGFFPNSQTSLPLATTVVTPEAGYIVELHVTHIVAGRSLFGGEDRTHMTAHHMNREPADRPNV